VAAALFTVGLFTCARLKILKNEAMGEYQAALRIDPDLAETHYNLGNALSQLHGGVPDAIAQYEAALRIGIDPTLQVMVNRLRAGRQ
jgi:tetratricopeptide (TPR) repeat protein